MDDHLYVCIFAFLYIHTRPAQDIGNSSAIKMEGNIMPPCHAFRIIVAAEDRSSAC